MAIDRYKFREIIKLDEWSGAHVEILIDQDDGLEVRSVDLIGDAWHDHVDSLKEAEFFSNKGNTHRENRALRHSLSTLMTHFEGVLTGVYRHLNLHLGKKRGAPVLAKAKEVEAKLMEEKGLVLPDLDTRFKEIRDILIHPYVIKMLESGEKISQADVFDLSLDELKNHSIAIDMWLGCLCEAFDHPRWYDTKEISEKYAKEFVKHYRSNLEEGPGGFPSFDELDAQTKRI